MARSYREEIVGYKTCGEYFMGSIINLGFFPKWVYGETMIMFSGERKAIKKLENTFSDLANGKSKEITFDKLEFIKAYKGIELYGFVSENDEYLENVAGDNVFHWVLPKHKWEEFASLISGFNVKDDRELLGQGAHQYLDTLNRNNLDIMVSVDEYTDDWWKQICFVEMF
ncbi:hypothetical protein ACHOLT_11600 [Desulfitobacterium sp. Sab5]|uniref:hypothetical protein n=1 Tax=Desulfitobacterium nosdiversum TaxID=3375356 RepID=UPI003CFBBAFE